jgi:signal transduction histidine kinase/ligand-binding sensor domain-containing protein
VWTVPNATKRQARLTIASLVALCLVVTPKAAALEPYVATGWTRKDGLPSTLIYAITQTRDGYLWLGTSDGLVRFDGFNFVHQRLFSDGHLLLGPVTALCAGNDGALWVGSSSGVLMRMSGSGFQKYALGSEIEAIVQSSEHNIWVVAQNRLSRFDSGLLTDLVPDEQIDAADVIRLLTSDATEVSLGSTTVVLQAGHDAATYARKIVLNGQTLFLNQGKKNTVWLSKKSFFKGSNISVALHDTRGNVWAGNAESGLLRTNDENGRYESELINDFIESLFEDREGNIWVGSNNGLFRFRRGKISSLTKRDGLSTDIVSSIEATGRTVWVGTQTGLNRIDDGRVHWLFRGLDILCLAAVQNQLWVSSSHGVFAIDAADRMPKPRPIATELSSVTALQAGAGGSIWLLDAQKGLYIWTGSALRPIKLNSNAGGKTISAIRARPDGGIWIGFLGGGLGFYKDGSFRECSAAGLPEGTVHDIYVDDSPNGRGLTWFATQTGLYRFDGQSFSGWNTESGLPGDRVLWLKADGDDALWLAFSTGVAKLRRSDLRSPAHKVDCEFYDSGDGLFADSIVRSQAAVDLDTEGRLWFTTSAGVAMIDSRHIEKNSVPPAMVIERVVADNREALIRRPMPFPPLTKNLQIDYNGLSLAEPQKVKYRYRLEGYDKEWHNAEGRRQAFYTNLQPGRYRFRVTAANNDGVWNASGASLDFAILPAFYQTRLFTIGCVVVGLAVGWALYRLRLQQLEAGLNSGFEERMSERTRIAQDLHDELLQSAMGVSLQIELTDALLEEQHAAKPHLERALRLSRVLMQKGRDVLRNLREEARGAADITKALSRTIEDVQRHGGPAARLIVEGQARALNALVAEDLIQIGSQAITNAFQHASANMINVYLLYKPAEFSLHVEDDGCGIEPQIAEAGRPGHYGLIGMKERAQRIGGTLTITSRVREGTKVKVSVPGKRAYGERLKG